ncbi:hypothetical protein [Sodalinema gerasimenkoae]|uniref:hypothetical protein n=1 Tax=Sodalinema gerasimenkoae TaxID=2862348 RepID=UPI0013576FCB|nr:hypothetical protein [Sodalinema gerasimenkoae]
MRYSAIAPVLNLYPQRDELKDWVSEVLGDRPRPEPPITPETARFPANQPLLHDNGFLAFPHPRDRSFPSESTPTP